MYEIALVPQEAVPREWLRVADLLAPAIKQSDGRHTSETVRRSLIRGEQQLWLVITAANGLKAAITTGVVEYPAKSVLGVHFIGGDGMLDWVGRLDARLRSFAADMGLEGLESVGRVGWTRVLRKFGWRQTMVMMERGLEPAREQQECNPWVKVAEAHKSPNPAYTSQVCLSTPSPTTGGWLREPRPRAKSRTRPTKANG